MYETKSKEKTLYSAFLIPSLEQKPQFYRFLDEKGGRERVSLKLF